MRLVADTVRGEGVVRALAILKVTHKRCARDLEKLVRSAVANLEQKSPGLDSGKLVLKTIQVDQGPEPQAVQGRFDGAGVPPVCTATAT